MIKNLVGLFVGENSKKRQMGLIAGLALSLLYTFDYIALDLYESLMSLTVFWTGAAFLCSIVLKYTKAVQKCQAFGTKSTDKTKRLPSGPTGSLA